MGIGAVVDRADAESIPLFGEYRYRGAAVRIEGTVQRACAGHGGDLDVHASTFEVLDPGEEIESAIHPMKSTVARVVSRSPYRERRSRSHFSPGDCERWILQV